MRLGLDFDNTLIQYDRVFYNTAFAKDLIPEDLGVNKTIIRNYIRSNKGPEVWTELQGTVYGKHIENAAPFDGAKEVLGECNAMGVYVILISHKTEWPVVSRKWNLQAAARTWLAAQGVFDEQRPENLLDEVWFEETRAKKFQRILSSECDLFIDDLPEFLTDNEFPKSCRPVLFDPMQIHQECARDLTRIRSWRELPDLIKKLDSAR